MQITPPFELFPFPTESRDPAVGAMDVEIVAARYSARRQSKPGFSVAATEADPT